MFRIVYSQPEDSVVCGCLWIGLRSWHIVSWTVSKDNIRTNILKIYSILLLRKKLTSDHPCHKIVNPGPV